MLKRLFLTLLLWCPLVASASDFSLEKLVDCYKKLHGFSLKEGYWIFPWDRWGKDGFYAFNDDSVWFSLFPEDQAATVKTRFDDFKGASKFGGSAGQGAEHALQWNIPGKGPVWFWLEVNKADATQSHFGQAASATGRVFADTTPTKVENGPKDRAFQNALEDYLVSLVVSYTGSYHHAFSHRQAPPSKSDYFDQLDTCSPAMDSNMQQVIKLEKQLVELLEKVKRS